MVKNKKDIAKKIGISILQIGAWALIFTLINKFVLMPVRVNGESMYPTLKDKEYKIAVRTNIIPDIDRYDIVIIRESDTEGNAINDRYIVKRVIALPGESIEIKDDHVLINDEIIDEPYLDTEFVREYVQEKGECFSKDMAKLTLSDDMYFCMGDNRPGSTDSRTFGPFSKEDILAKVFRR